MQSSNSLHSQILAIYEDRRRRQQDALLERMEEIYAKCPAYKELEDAIKDTFADRSIALIHGDETKAQLLKRREDDLIEQKQLVLSFGGFPEGYDKLRYDCELCKDTGFVNGKRCSCYRQLMTRLLYETSEIKELLEKENFDTFSFEYFDKETIDPNTGRSAYEIMKYNYDIAKEFVTPFVPGKSNLLFIGAAGTGKTFLSNCIAREVIAEGHSVVYLSAATLFDRLAQMTFGKSGESEEKAVIMDCDLLIIDDLGTEFNNSFVSSQLFYCINERKLKNRSTIISTNLDLEKLKENYSERVSSRFIENYRICRFFNTDIRRKKRREGAGRKE